jgi:hypothetical protein
MAESSLTQCLIRISNLIVIWIDYTTQTQSVHKAEISSHMTSILHILMPTLLRY